MGFCRSDRSERLIIAREHDNLQDIISSSYPYVYEHEKISECMEILTDYEEDSIPVLTQDKKIAGILTSSDIVELVDERWEMTMQNLLV